MNIVFVDDQPILKVQSAIKYLEKKMNFDYKILESENEAMHYISKNAQNIDLVVLDLGLPVFKKDYDFYNEFGGYGVMHEIISRLRITNIPIIINSAAKIEFVDGRSEDEHFKEEFPNTIIEHVKYLEGDWLEEFIKKHLSHKI